MVKFMFSSIINLFPHFIMFNIQIFVSWLNKINFHERLGLFNFLFFIFFHIRILILIIFTILGIAFS